MCNVSKIYFWTLSLVFILSANKVIGAENPMLEVERSYLIAKQKAEESKKPYIVQFTAPWCNPCEWLNETSFEDPEIISLINRSYVYVMMDIEGFEGYTLKQYYNVNNIPGILIFSYDHKLLGRLEGTVTKHTLLQTLNECVSQKAPISKDTFKSNRALINRSIPANEDTSPSSPLHDENTTGGPVIPDPPTTFGGQAYAIQIGVFSSYDNARKKEKELQERITANTFLANVEINGSTVYKVYVGHFESQKESDLMHKRLLAMGIEGWTKKISLTEKI